MSSFLLQLPTNMHDSRQQGWLKVIGFLPHPGETWLEFLAFIFGLGPALVSPEVGIKQQKTALSLYLSNKYLKKITHLNIKVIKLSKLIAGPRT